MQRRDRYLIYTDESCHNDHRYMILGGGAVPEEDIHVVNDAFRACRDRAHMHGEYKWTKVTEQKFSEYRNFVNCFFTLNMIDSLHFHSMIIDTHKLDHARFNAGDRQLGFYKFYYQLLLHSFGARYGRRCHLYAYLDSIQSSYPLIPASG